MPSLTGVTQRKQNCLRFCLRMLALRMVHYGVIPESSESGKYVAKNRCRFYNYPVTFRFDEN
jgi:hypothetical protein